MALSTQTNVAVASDLDKKPLFSQSNFTGAIIIAQFFYVAAQVGVAALFINYCTVSSKQQTNL